jgi:hypothetical protein
VTQTSTGVKRNVHPEVGAARGKLGIAVLRGDEAAVARCRQDLYDANLIAAADAVVDRLPQASPEIRERIAAKLGGA